MSTKQLHFFAAPEDIGPVIETFESKLSVSYSDAGMFDNDEIQNYQTYKIIPGFGTINSGDWNHSPIYLIHKKESIMNTRTVILKSGDLRYAVYQDTNPETIVFKPSGTWKDNILVAGSIGTISEKDPSIEMFKEFSKLLKKSFNKIGSFYVGNSAKQKLDEGWRLVTNSKSPQQYDLKYT